mgnify:CR=1 FL=1
MFYMGNSLTTLVQATQEIKGRLNSMGDMVNTMQTLSLLGQPNDSILFHRLDRKEF